MLYTTLALAYGALGSQRHCWPYHENKVYALEGWFDTDIVELSDTIHSKLEYSNKDLVSHDNP